MSAFERRAEILGSICQHRVLSTPQIRAIHLPEYGERWSQRVMASLAEEGLVSFTRVPGGIPDQPRRLWFISEEGAEAARAAGVIEGPVHILTAKQVVGPLQAHTLAVNDSGISFLRAARDRGDEFGPMAWRHEVAHPVGGGRTARARKRVVADAVLTYLRITSEEIVVEQRFLEVDRNTLTVDRLGAELSRYATLYRAPGDDGEPRWKSWYPWFPPIICVLAGASRAALERRRETVSALLSADQELERADGVSIRICLAEDLDAEGPFAPIFNDPRRPGASVSWLVEEGE
ncbi:MAG TPA: replication-relaxation family protein [Solirubrobacterales bacterium]|nr:replication-relaxation family protein [Solirubrobacterales bacterium]